MCEMDVYKVYPHIISSGSFGDPFAELPVGHSVSGVKHWEM